MRIGVMKRRREIAVHAIFLASFLARVAVACQYLISLGALEDLSYSTVFSREGNIRNLAVTGIDRFICSVLTSVASPISTKRQTSLRKGTHDALS